MTLRMGLLSIILTTLVPKGTKFGEINNAKYRPLRRSGSFQFTDFTNDKDKTQFKSCLLLSAAAAGRNGQAAATVRSRRRCAAFDPHMVGAQV